MAVFHAASEQYELGELDGRLVAFTNMRLDRQTIPAGLHCYDIRDSDNCDGTSHLAITSKTVRCA